MRSVISSENKATIFVNGKFHFDTRLEFNEEFEKVLKYPGDKIIIDLSGTTDIDASALGMLLMAKDKAANVGKKIVLANANTKVANILLMAKFDTRIGMI
jgi:anti-anti-sigma factor